jgi:TetR/AcrR family fatty acid metabolism transcriptional regulator
MPRHAGRPAEVTRERILDAAAEVLARRGYDAANVDEIARKSGASKGAIYFHFPSKEEMALHLVQKLSEKLIDKVRRSIASEPPSQRRVGLAVQALLDTFARKRALGQLLLVNIVGRGRTLDRKFMPVRRKFQDFIREELDSAVAVGALPETVDTELASQLWLGALHEVILHWLLDNHPQPLSSCGPLLQSMLLQGIAGPPSAKEPLSNG